MNNFIKGFLLILLTGITLSLQANYTVTNSWTDNGQGYWYLSSNNCGGQTLISCAQPGSALPPVGHNYSYSGGYFYPNNNAYQTGSGNPINCCNVNFTVSTENASCGQNNGKLNIDPDVNGGVNLPFQVYYDYNGQQYYGGGGFNDYTNNYVVNLPAGSYTNVKVIDANGCEKVRSGPFNIGGGFTPNASANNNGPITCNDGNVQLSASGGGSYSWSGPSGFSSSQQSPTVSNPGTYTVTVINNQGCTDQASTTVQNNVINLNPSASNNGPLTCDGSVQLSITGNNTNNASYSWTGPGGFTSSQKSPTVAQAGTYTVTVTKNGCTGQASTTVQGNTDSPTVTANNSGGPLTCDDNEAQLTASASGANNYSWSGPAGFSSTMQNPTVSQAGTYTVTVTAANGCTASASTTINSNTNAPNANASNDGPLNCGNDNVQLNATGGGSYSWSGPAGFTSTMQNPTVSQAGTYTVTVTSNNGCTDTASTTVQGDNAAPTAVASADNNGVLSCETGSVMLSGSSNMTNVSYSWSGPNGFSSTMQNPTVMMMGTYTVTVTKNDTGCSAMADVVVTLGACEYDLALIKILAPGQSSITQVGEPVNFVVKVTNQGQTNSGAFTVMDRLPMGLTFTNASNGGTHNNGTVTWELDDLDEGEFIELAVTATVDALGTGKYVNWAEITSDSGDDSDSTPDTNTGSGFIEPNDLVNNHNDMMLDNAPNDEDDNDFEEIFIERGLQVAPRVMLQGAMLNSDSNDLMRADLSSENLIPTSEPYTAMSNFEHVGFGGGEIVDQNILSVTGANAIVDWVLVEVRNPNNPAVVLETAAGLLQADGDVVAADGVSPLSFPSLENDYYQVAVRHRNHLGVMTQSSTYLTSDYSTTVDFTSPSTSTYGTFAQHQMNNGKMALWAGSTTGSESVSFQGGNADVNSTFFTVLGDPNNTSSDINYISTGYHTGDVDLDCNAVYQGNNSDVNNLFFNIFLHPGNISNLTNYTIQGTLPD